MESKSELKRSQTGQTGYFQHDPRPGRVLVHGRGLKELFLEFCAEGSLVYGLVVDPWMGLADLRVVTPSGVWGGFV